MSQIEECIDRSQANHRSVVDALQAQQRHTEETKQLIAALNTVPRGNGIAEQELERRKAELARAEAVLKALNDQYATGWEYLEKTYTISEAIKALS